MLACNALSCGTSFSRESGISKEQMHRTYRPPPSLQPALQVELPVGASLLAKVAVQTPKIVRLMYRLREQARPHGRGRGYDRDAPATVEANPNLQ